MQSRHAREDAVSCTTSQLPGENLAVIFGDSCRLTTAYGGWSPNHFDLTRPHTPTYSTGRASANRPTLAVGSPPPINQWDVGLLPTPSRSLAELPELPQRRITVFAPCDRGAALCPFLIIPQTAGTCWRESVQSESLRDQSIRAHCLADTESISLECGRGGAIHRMRSLRLSRDAFVRARTRDVAFIDFTNDAEHVNGLQLH